MTKYIVLTGIISVVWTLNGITALFMHVFLGGLMAYLWAKEQRLL